MQLVQLSNSLVYFCYSWYNSGTVGRILQQLVKKEQIAEFQFSLVQFWHSWYSFGTVWYIFCTNFRTVGAILKQLLQFWNSLVHFKYSWFDSGTVGEILDQFDKMLEQLA